MAYLGHYIDGKYEVTQYSGGGTVRNRLTGEIVASYGNPWTPDGSPHPSAVEKVALIEQELGIKINL